MGFLISGIQQIGIGVTNVQEANRWYRQHLGFDINIVDEDGTAERMLKYTGGKPQRRHAVIAVNLEGGGGLEIWQYKTRQPQYPANPPELGDLGIYAAKIKTRQPEKALAYFKDQKLDLLSDMLEDPQGRKHFFFRDPYGNILQMVEESNVFKPGKGANGGVCGAIVGVSDMERAIAFYSKVLGYTQTEYQQEGKFSEFSCLPRGDAEFLRVLLTPGDARKGAFSRLLGKDQIELISVKGIRPHKIYEGRYWGDPGFIQICYDVRNMKSLKKHCENLGFPFTADSNPEIYEEESRIFDMGDAAGHFTYVEDPDGTLIECVETHKIPVIKKIGWHINLMKRKNQEKPLPDFILKSLSFARIKD